MAKKNLTKKEDGAKKAKGTPNKLNIKDKKLKKKPKAVAYCRISTRTNKDKAGMKRQFFACKAIKETRGYNLNNLLQPAQDESKALTCCRINPPTNKDTAGMKRQCSTCEAIAETRGYNLVDSIDEVISGSLPTDGREVFDDLLKRAQDKNIGHILIENSRALARDADLRAELRKKARAVGVTILCGDTASDDPRAIEVWDSCSNDSSSNCSNSSGSATS